MSRGIKVVREGYAEGGRIPVYGREGEITHYLDAPAARPTESQPIASFAQPATQGTLTFPEARPGAYAGHYVRDRPQSQFSPFGFSGYAQASQANPFAQFAGMRDPEFVPIRSTLGRGYESIYGANLPTSRFDVQVSTAPEVSVTPLSTAEKVAYLERIARAGAPITNISNTATGGAGGTGGSATGGAGGSATGGSSSAVTGPITATGGTGGSATGGTSSATTGPVSATGGTSSATTGPVTATGGTSSATTGPVSSSVGNVAGGSATTGPITATGGTGGSSSVGNVTGGSSSSTVGNVTGGSSSSSVGNVTGGTSSVGNVTGGTSSVGNVTGGTSSVGNVTGGGATLGDIVNTATGTGGSSSSTSAGGSSSVGNVTGGGATLRDVALTATGTGTGGSSTATGGSTGPVTATGTGTGGGATLQDIALQSTATGTGTGGSSTTTGGGATLRDVALQSTATGTGTGTGGSSTATGTGTGTGGSSTATGTGTGTGGGATTTNTATGGTGGGTTGGGTATGGTTATGGGTSTTGGLTTGGTSTTGGTTTGGTSTTGGGVTTGDTATGGTTTGSTTGGTTTGGTTGGTVAESNTGQATLREIVGRSESEPTGVVRDTDLPGSARSDLPSAQRSETSLPTDPGDARGLFEGDRSVTSGALGPFYGDTPEASQEIRDYVDRTVRDATEGAGQGTIRGTKDNLPHVDLPTFPGGVPINLSIVEEISSLPRTEIPPEFANMLASAGSADVGRAQGTSGRTGADIARDVMAEIGGQPERAANMGVRGEYDPNAVSPSALEGLAAAIQAAAPFTGGVMGPAVVSGIPGLLASGLPSTLGISNPTSALPSGLSTAASLIISPVGTLAGMFLGEEGRRRVDAHFTKETADMARNYADQVLSGNMTADQAATAAVQDLGSVGRAGAVLEAIEQAREDREGGRAHQSGQESGSEYGGMSEADRGAMAAAEGFGGQYGGPDFAHGGPVNMSHIADFIRRQVRQDMARGGYVPGGSGGMDDDVPAVIDGNRPARLSSGEFVFDAATVAALGDGNNQAGARKLNQLRHAIRQKAYGHRRQPPKNYSLGDLVEMT